MVKRKDNNKIISKSLFLGVLGIVFVIALYLMFASSGIFYSPVVDGISFENAKSYIIGLGPNGVEWYCGKREFFTDANGKQYGAKSLEELKRILGNEARLMSELCSE